MGLHAAPKPLPSPHLHPQANRPLGLLGGFLKVAEPGDVSLISAWPRPPTLSLKPKAGVGVSCDFSSGMQARHRNFQSQNLCGLRAWMQQLPLFDTLESWDGLAWLRRTVDGRGVCYLDHNLQAG